MRSEIIFRLSFNNLKLSFSLGSEWGTLMPKKAQLIHSSVIMSQQNTSKKNRNDI